MNRVKMTDIHIKLEKFVESHNNFSQCANKYFMLGEQLVTQAAKALATFNSFAINFIMTAN